MASPITLRFLLLCPRRMWFLAILVVVWAQTTPPSQKLVVNGVWEETGNRLPDNWVGPPYATCSSTVGASGYPGDGNTCGFANWISYMPQIYKDG